MQSEGNQFCNVIVYKVFHDLPTTEFLSPVSDWFWASWKTRENSIKAQLFKINNHSIYSQ